MKFTLFLISMCDSCNFFWNYFQSVDGLNYLDIVFIYRYCKNIIFFVYLEKYGEF